MPRSLSHSKSKSRAGLTDPSTGSFSTTSSRRSRHHHGRITATPSRGHMRTTPSRSDMRKQSSRAEVRPSTSRAHMRASPSRGHMRASPSRGHMRASPSRGHMRATSSRSQMRASPSRGQMRASPSRSQMRSTPSGVDMRVSHSHMRHHGSATPRQHAQGGRSVSSHRKHTPRMSSTTVYVHKPSHHDDSDEDDEYDDHDSAMLKRKKGKRWFGRKDRNVPSIIPTSSISPLVAADEDLTTAFEVIRRGFRRALQFGNSGGCTPSCAFSKGKDDNDKTDKESCTSEATRISVGTTGTRGTQCSKSTNARFSLSSKCSAKRSQPPAAQLTLVTRGTPQNYPNMPSYTPSTHMQAMNPLMPGSGPNPQIHQRPPGFPPPSNQLHQSQQQQPFNSQMPPPVQQPQQQPCYNPPPRNTCEENNCPRARACGRNRCGNVKFHCCD